jgi:predicted ATP-grasp superfamily ATP-dependent carboligase
MKTNITNLKTLVISTNEHLTLRLLRCLGVLSIKTDILALGKSSQSTKVSRFCQKYTTYPENILTSEWEAIADHINQYCRQEKIDVIIPSGIQATFTLSKIQPLINTAKIFPLDRPETIQRIHNKWHLYADCSPLGLSFPKSILLENIKQLQNLDLQFPIMVKPIELADGRGIKRLDSLAETENYLTTTQVDNQLPLILQEYVDGFDIDLSVLANQGEIIAWTVQQAFPHHIEIFNNDTVLELGKQMISFYNFTGVAHFDLRVDKITNQIKILECNPRLWASIEASLWYGVDFIHLGILLALGSTIPPELQRGVLSAQPTKIPYPWLGKTIKGYVKRKFPAREIPQSSMGIIWQNLADIYPTVYDKILTRLGKGAVNDDLAELLASKLNQEQPNQTTL